MLEVSALYIYPIKSLGGIEVSSAVVTDRGFRHDRRWLLVDMNNRFMTQREITQMALLQVTIETDGLRITHKIKGENILIPFTPQNGESCEVTVWDSIVTAQYVSDEVDQWFSRMLGMACRLVYMPDDSHRRVDVRYARDGEITTFADDYPFLLIGQSSLDDLNTRLAKPLPMNRFRPNIVFTGADAYAEDIMKSFTISGIKFKGVKLCARCVMTTIDQNTAQKHKEPLKTLATYRNKDKKIMFGQNLLHKGIGVIAVGDILENVRLHEDERFIV